jgi:catechol 2,3-dioxygenase-like lactoylglutathione lyase family enzyme
MKRLAAVTLLVHDYDEAIDFFTRALRFRLLEDTPLQGGKRWVVVGPGEESGVSQRTAAGVSQSTAADDSPGAALLLARASTPEQSARVGDQSGGRVAFFLHTRDFWDDYNYMLAAGVRFTEPPRQEPYGQVVVFLDLYGNKWDLVQPSQVG